MNKRDTKSLTITVSFLLTVLLTLSLSGCKYLNNNTATSEQTVSQKIEHSNPIDSSKSNFQDLKNPERVFDFYKSNSFKVAWTKQNETVTDADSLLKFIEFVRYYGLRPQRYHKAELDQCKNSIDQKSWQHRFDLLLTDAFFSLVNDLQHGTRNQQVSDSLKPDLSSALEKHAVNDFLRSLQPTSYDYQVCQQYLSTLLMETDSCSRELFLEGSEHDTSEVAKKIHTLEVNMNRMRRDRNIRGRYLLVNIPAFELSLMDHDTLVFNSRVIVGTEKNETPILEGKIKSFTIFPYWNVPRKIAVDELLPQIIADSTYLGEHSFEILDIDGRRVDPGGIDFSELNTDNFPYLMRQKEGLFNSLGVIKFTFKNSYAVYLHDTNARLLFKKEARALSHGCVRVEKALELSRYLLEGNDLVTADDLDQYLELHQQMTIRIPEAIPIYIRYYTVGVKDGEVKFYDDVYGMDEEESEELKYKANI